MYPYVTTAETVHHPIDTHTVYSEMPAAYVEPHHDVVSYSEPVYGQETVYREEPAYRHETVYRDEPAYHHEATVYRESPTYHQETIYHDEPVGQYETVYSHDPVYHDEHVYHQDPLAHETMHHEQEQDGILVHPTPAHHAASVVEHTYSSPSYEATHYAGIKHEDQHFHDLPLEDWVTYEHGHMPPSDKDYYKRHPYEIAPHGYNVHQDLPLYGIHFDREHPGYHPELDHKFDDRHDIEMIPYHDHVVEAAPDIPDHHSYHIEQFP